MRAQPRQGESRGCRAGSSQESQTAGNTSYSREDWSCGTAEGRDDGLAHLKGPGNLRASYLARTQITKVDLVGMNKLETRALGGCSNITTPTRRS